MKKYIGPAIAGILMIVAMTLMGLKFYAVKRAANVVNKCYWIEQQSTIFIVTSYVQGKFDIEGTYRVEGIALGFMPFQSSIKQNEMEDKVLSISEEIPCNESPEEKGEGDNE